MSDAVIKELARDCASIAKANGFDETTLTNLPGKLMFVIDELCREAREAAYLTGLCDGSHSLEVELADGLIRLLACMYDLYGDDWNERGVTNRLSTKFQFVAYERLVSTVVHYVCLAAECWRHDKMDDVKYSLEIAIPELIHVAQCLDIDVLTSAGLKCAKNRKRGHLHGKTRSLG